MLEYAEDEMLRAVLLKYFICKSLNYCIIFLCALCVITCFYYLFFACQTFHWPLGITITCHCDLFSIHASFGSGNVAPVSFLNNNMNEGRWTQDKHKIFMQEYEKNGNNCMQNAKVLSTQTPTQIKKNAECFFKQNLKTNSAAVKRY